MSTRLELCKELYHLSRWDGKELPEGWYWYADDSDFTPFVGTRVLYDNTAKSVKATFIAPDYDLSYLLRKLPKSMTAFWGQAYPASPVLMYSGSQWIAYYHSEMTGEHNDDEAFNQFADTPEDAVCKLAIKLFKHGMLIVGS